MGRTADNRAPIIAAFERCTKEVQAQFPTMALKGPGRRNTVHGRAIMMVATDLGISDAEVRWAVYRDEANKARNSLANPAKIKLEEEFLQDIGIIKAEYRSCLQSVIRFKSILTRVERSERPLQKNRFASLRKAVEELGELVKGMQPEMLCPWCKGVGGVQENCVACEGSAYVCVQQMNGIPSKLPAKRVVVIDGREVPLSKYGIPEPPSADLWGLDQ